MRNMMQIAAYEVKSTVFSDELHVQGKEEKTDQKS